MVAAYSYAAAQDAVMNVRCRTSVPAGQPFQITFDVNARASNFKMPTLKGLTLMSGPSTGFSSSTTFINGKMSQSVSNTFTIVVAADHEGTANVGAASCTVDGKTVSSRPFSITIEKESPQSANSQRGGWGQPRSQQRQQQQQQQQEPAKTIDGNTLFARASINKSNLYQGEEAIIVYKIYTQVPLTQFQIDKLPRNKGFWSEDLSENMTQVKQYSETLNGRQYQVAEIRRGALYPQENGKLTIAPLKTDVVAIVQTRSQRQRTGTILDFFIDDPFFSIPQQQAVVKSLTSNSISVNVKPLPEAPESFAGGVGNFNVSAKSDLKELHANEAFTYSVTISGRGNLSLLEAPVIDFPKGMETYEPRVIDNINMGDNGLSGSRTFEWVVTPQTQGEYDMPAFDYTYFDPSAGHYVTKQCNRVHIKVSKPLNNVASKSDVTELNSDIHHIMKDAKLHKAGQSGHVPAAFWLVLLLAAVASAAAVLYARHQQHIAGDEASMRLQRANKLAKKRLRNAEKQLDSGNDELFYEEIYKALWGGIADKFNIPLASLSSDTIRQQLAGKSVDEALQQQILDTLHDVDFARFAPGDSSSKKLQIFNEAMATITNIAAIRIKR
ncbi:MAG: protein BatD [Bacteroidales bacterium]|nr:protein BatD [Bacteroidales bacterium]